jgi:hypothetical protein
MASGTNGAERWDVRPTNKSAILVLLGTLPFTQACNLPNADNPVENEFVALGYDGPATRKEVELFLLHTRVSTTNPILFW